MKNKVVFLDRDGTINVEKNYLYKIEDFEFEDGVIESLKILQQLDFKLIVISNQSGIERGYYTKEDAIKLFDYMCKELEKESIKIDGVYFCPHYKTLCDCRKPKLGLFYQAQKDFDIDFSKSFAIGDKLRDLEICNKENVRGFLIDKNLDNKIEINNSKIQVCSNILEIANKIKMEDDINGNS